MPLKWKLLMPIASVATAGGVSYPYLFSGDGGGISRDSSLVLNLENPTFDNSRSLQDINSGKASSVSLSPLNSSRSPSLELHSATPTLELDTNSEMMQADTISIQGLQTELDKENKVGELSAEQLKEFEEAIKYIQGAKQAFSGLVDKVKEYRKTSASKGDTSSTRTFDESGAQYLTQSHRESLMKFFEMYSKLESLKSANLSKLDSLIIKSKGQHNGLEIKDAGTNKIFSNLNKINWNSQELKVISSDSDEENWGWGNWEQNPYSSFYSQESVWKQKAERIKYSLDIARLNKKDVGSCSSDFSGTNTERDQAIKAWCDNDNDRFTKLVEGYKSEIELDIASWLLDKMQIILEERDSSR